MPGTPRAVVFLTADAFGVLPPISRLTREQAAYHFISGYTAKLAGTEVGIKEPKATFSACFGAPFMPRHPGEYAPMLIERLERDDVPVWLVNTGWTGGPYGTGERMNIAHTRAMVRAALDGRSRASQRGRIRSSASRSRRPARTCPPIPRSTLDLGGPGRGPTTGRRRSWPGCSARTSPPTPTASTRRSPRPVPGDGHGAGLVSAPHPQPGGDGAGTRENPLGPPEKAVPREKPPASQRRTARGTRRQDRPMEGAAERGGGWHETKTSLRSDRVSVTSDRMRASAVDRRPASRRSGPPDQGRASIRTRRGERAIRPDTHHAGETPRKGASISPKEARERGAGPGRAVRSPQAGPDASRPPETHGGRKPRPDESPATNGRGRESAPRRPARDGEGGHGGSVRGVRLDRRPTPPPDNRRSSPRAPRPNVANRGGRESTT